MPPPGSDYVSPDWGPPKDRRPRWLPYVVVLVVAALVAGGFFVADRVGDRPFETRAQRFVPDDGAVQYTVRRAGGAAADVPFVTESARLTGAAEFTAIDFTFGGALLPSIDLDVDGLAGVGFWRTTTTQIGTPESSQQLVRVYRVDGPVSLLGESGPDGAYAYRPALVELPADVTSGATWSGEGSAGATLNYRSEFRATAAERGCLQVSGTITYTDKSGQASTPRTVEKTWCAAEGVTREVITTGDRTVTQSTLRGPPALPAVQTTGDPVTWRDPRTWQHQDFSTVSIDQNFGPGIMTGAPSAVPPVLTASGLVIRPTSSSDLVAFTNKTPTEWGSLWRMHPGGTVVSLTAFGDVVVATTSLRQVVGYSADGVRLWQHDLAEVAFHGPVRIDDGRAALVDGGGTVRVLDIASGRQRWQKALRSDVLVSPVADARAVLVADRSGNLTAWQPDDGTQLWRRDLEVAGATIVGNTVVTYSAATLTAVDITDGATRWLEPLTGTVDALVGFDGRVVLATHLGTTVRAEDGAVEARLDPYVLLTITDDYLVGWGNAQTEVIDRRLGVVRTLDTPDRNLTTAGNWPVADRFGVMLFAGDWSFQTWGDQS